jgi:hypothetical protein
MRVERDDDDEMVGSLPYWVSGGRRPIADQGARVASLERDDLRLGRGLRPIRCKRGDKKGNHVLVELVNERLDSTRKTESKALGGAGGESWRRGRREDAQF